ncbi:YgiT-type zinc finger protein [Alicyclobacillus sp. SP_1]|jgi:YgiT-type zinc finger domain-containing protein|uniref:YgiT-type zinc finger protein n=1 Tax=Alicyclobacillus sp. SP_1 TaxID=2942475 RepID=UPI00215701EC|nr:YgiT-type zinc finger protein [Alicyclobacillus sp. SP_1]MCY0870736.1 YgiT-type zinc finger protein [Bacillota bacterium]
MLREPDIREERVRAMLRLKAALWAHGDESLLLERSITAYQEPIYDLPETVTCSECGHTLSVRGTDYPVPERNVVIRDVPFGYCEHCNTLTGSLFLMAALDAYAEQMEPNASMTLEEALR